MTKGGSVTTAEDLMRMDAIEEYGLVGPDAAADLDGLVQLAATACGVTTAVINVIDERFQHQIAAVGFEPSVCAREDSMCAVVFHSGAPVVVGDARRDPRFAANPFVTGELGRVRFYASSPLVTPDGIAIGTLCIFDESVGALSADRARALDLLAGQVIEVLELRRLTDELSRSNSVLSRFAGQISHDLANPLTAIGGYLELAADHLETADAARAGQAIGRAESAVTRMEAMLSGLLGFARVGGRLDRTTVALDALGDAVRDDLGGLLATSDAVLRVDPGGQLHADPTLIRALLQNVVSNALKYTAGAGIRPEVSIFVEEVLGGRRLVVDDNGPGVPEADRDRVFGLLERGADEQSTGSGIGLATCRRIALAHEGRIGIDRSPAGGARVWTFLPDGA